MNTLHDTRDLQCSIAIPTLVQMPSLLAVLLIFASSAFAASPVIHVAVPTLTPFPPGGRPECFTPFDHHNVSNVIDMCFNLIETFVHSFGEKMNTSLRWTGNNSEITHPDVVHLPQVITEHNRTAACLLEVVDRGNGDSFEPSSLMDHGVAVLTDCFEKNDCGEIPLPPHYTTTLAVCGTYHENTTTRGERQNRPLLDFPYVDYAVESSVL